MLFITDKMKNALGSSCLGLITSAEEGGYVFSSVCLSVCLSVRRITRKLVNGF